MKQTGSVSRPWHKLYPSHVPATVPLPASDVISMFRDHVVSNPAAPALHYFGRTLSRLDVDEMSDRLAAGLRQRGLSFGDRLALALQNTPIFVIAVLAVWKAGSTVVPVNPMLRARELAYMVNDSGCTVLIADPAMRQVVDAIREQCPKLQQVVWSHPADLAGDMPGNWTKDHSVVDQDDSVGALLDAGKQLEVPETPLLDPALLTYTSGTTGPSKGAMNRHESLVYEAAVGRQWFGLTNDDVVLATAPLFHITGLGVHLALALANGLPLVLTHRFEPGVVTSLVERYRPTFTVGALTAFIALLGHDDMHPQKMASLKTVFSGGAPVNDAVVQRYEQTFGVYVHNIYGLTESTSACIGVPLGQRAPVDNESGALSIGVPMPNTDVRIVDDSGADVPVSELGEICVRGPQVIEGYWQRLAESANAIRDGWLHTGDVGFMDKDGWMFIVDRKKDMIVVSGYKVWPREVEDTLYEHEAVQEAAVVGVPDSYRGETVYAYVTLRPGQIVSVEELEAYCRERLAAYKCPRTFHIVHELPKTATGKILRRTLRDQAGCVEGVEG